MSVNGILICPVCRGALIREEKSYFCNGAKKHCFDISSSGHTNLYPGRVSGGDDKKAVKSRTDFLNLGFYLPLAQKLCDILSKEFDLGKDNITPEITFSELGLDSLQIVDAVMRIEETFGVEISDEEMEKFRSLSDVCNFLES